MCRCVLGRSALGRCVLGRSALGRSALGRSALGSFLVAAAERLDQPTHGLHLRIQHVFVHLAQLVAQN